ncbi:hypothetical protein C1H46_002989 [Malus baccata]|uniref:Uncharacterized protein n=1 Tax=Malus baccata TaxID=106549 RepID=A0A540NK69_MALBA|nr:hypothetical protein C1H46_002989 [Malus baccata]
MVLEIPIVSEVTSPRASSSQFPVNQPFPLKQLHLKSFQPWLKTQLSAATADIATTVAALGGVGVVPSLLASPPAITSLPN